MAVLASMILAAALAHAPAPASHRPAAGSVCPGPPPFADGFRVLDAVRVVKGASGESEFVPLSLTAVTRAYFKPGELFASLNFGPAEKVQIVSGPPNVTLPFHASLGYEVFLTIQGSSTVVLPNGQQRMLRPGSLVIMEDMGSTHGHSGVTGPCGYVSVQMVPKNRLDVVTPAAAH